MTAFPSAWFVGCGQMAGALVEGWKKSGVDFAKAIAVRPSGREVEGVRTLAKLPEGAPPRLCILGFKPQKLAEISPALAPRLSGETVLVSMLAGVEAATLRGLFPKVAAVVRIMPNLPVAERRGVTALYSEDSGEDLRGELEALFALLGIARWNESEKEFAAVGALAGAGPAYVARFVAALAKAGEQRGLGSEQAARIALQTVLGTAAMADARGEEMESVARRVASPGGTTEAGLKVLDADQALDRLVGATLEAAARRGRELAEEAKAAAGRGDLAGDGRLP